MSNKQILNVAISSPGESFAHFAKVWDAAAGGKKVKPYNRIGFESIAQFAAALTPQRWLLINALKGIGPSSIYALAKKLERHYKNVHTLSLIHISEPTRLGMISYAVFCL